MKSIQITFLPSNRIDRKRWDQCISEALNGNICVYSWFLDILCNGWGGLVAGDYDLVMPLPARQRFGIPYLFQPRFIQQLGVFGNTLPDPEIVNAFIASIPASIKAIDYHFNHQNLLTTGYRVETRANFVLNLNRSYEQLKADYSQNLTRNLSKSGHSLYHIVKTTEAQPIIKLFRQGRGNQLSAIGDADYRRLHRAIQAAIEREMGEVWSAYDSNNELCAGIVWLYSHQKALFYFSGQSQAGRLGGALAWLIDAFIQEKAQSDLQLDFEGSVDPGLARFYAGFGPLQQPYPRLRINHLSPVVNLVYRFYKKLQKD